MNPTTKALLVYAAAVGGLLFAVHAKAASVEVGAGVAQARTQGNGIWYQDGFQHTLDLRSPVVMLGIKGDLSQHFAWHVNAVDLGSYSVNSQDTPNDANYSGDGYTGNALPLANYVGSGSVYGIAATLQAHTAGAWQFGVDAGPFVYHASWSLSVPNWYPSQQIAKGVFEATGPVDPVATSDAHWALGYVAGVSLSHGPLSFSLSYYSDGAGFNHGADPWPPLWKGQTVAMVTYTF